MAYDGEKGLLLPSICRSDVNDYLVIGKEVGGCFADLRGVTCDQTRDLSSKRTSHILPTQKFLRCIIVRTYQKTGREYRYPRPVMPGSYGFIAPIYP